MVAPGVVVHDMGLRIYSEREPGFSVLGNSCKCNLRSLCGKVRKNLPQRNLRFAPEDVELLLLHVALQVALLQLARLQLHGDRAGQLLRARHDQPPEERPQLPRAQLIAQQQER